jgi:hypothetical protein
MAALHKTFASTGGLKKIMTTYNTRQARFDVHGSLYHIMMSGINRATNIVVL